MLIANTQKEIEVLCTRFAKEMADYRNAIKEDMKLLLVKPLYQRAKATMKKLKIAMIEYEQLITNDMAAYNNTHI